MNTSKWLRELTCKNWSDLLKMWIKWEAKLNKQKMLEWFCASNFFFSLNSKRRFSKSLSSQHHSTQSLCKKKKKEKKILHRKRRLFGDEMKSSLGENYPPNVIWFIQKVSKMGSQTKKKSMTVNLCVFSPISSVQCLPSTLIILCVVNCQAWTYNSNKKKLDNK